MTEADLVFGAKARRRALQAQQRLLEEMAQQIEQERAELGLYQAFYDAARQIKPLDMARAVAQVLETASERKEISQRLNGLDLTECEALDGKIKEVKRSLEKLSARRSPKLLPVAPQVPAS